MTADLTLSKHSLDQGGNLHRRLHHQYRPLPAGLHPGPHPRMVYHHEIP
jgi:hypothetical protein